MIDEMGIFRTDISIAHPARPGDTLGLSGVMVDTGSEYNWIPEHHLEELGIIPVRVDRFETADGTILQRRVGFGIIYAADRSAATAVVFAGPGDLALLGAHGLQGLNVRVDLNQKELVPAGPVPAAAA